MSRYTATLSPQESPASQRIDQTALEEEIRPYHAPMRSISGFIGPRSWLSNTHMVTLLADGILYPSAEHAFLASRTNDPGLRRDIAQALSITHAGRLIRNLKINPEWRQTSTAIMLEILRAKFSDPALAAELVDTGTVPLINLNYWGDRHWGAEAEGTVLHGGNRLGQCLMQVRTEQFAARNQVPARRKG